MQHLIFVKKHKKYFITVALGLAIVLIILLSKGTFTQTAYVVVFGNLCDAFFVAGSVIIGVGLLIFVTNGGAFDLLSYGSMRLWGTLKRDALDVKYRNYYDYRAAQKEKKRRFGYLLTVGAAFIAVAVVFLILYYNAL